MSVRARILMLCILFWGIAGGAVAASTDADLTIESQGITSKFVNNSEGLKAFGNDAIENAELLIKCDEMPELVVAWGVLNDVGYVSAKADISTLKLFNKVDELGEGALKTKLLSKLDDAKLVKFSDDFTEASEEAFGALSNNEGLIDYWKTNGVLLRAKTYPNSSNIDWNTTKNTIQSGTNNTDKVILQAIEEQVLIMPLTNSKPVMAGAYCSELGGDVIVKYNLSSVEKVSFNYNSLEPVIKDKIDYLNFIRQDAIDGGNLYKKLYSGVSKEKIITAGDAASHAEVLALDAVIKEMKKAGIYSSKADLDKVSILVKGKGDWGNMCRCPHCFHLTDGVKMIGNQ